MSRPLAAKPVVKPETASGSKPPSARIGIFRRIAVERYAGPLEADTPALLTPWRSGLLAAGLLLLGAAIALLGLF